MQQTAAMQALERAYNEMDAAQRWQTWTEQWDAQRDRWLSEQTSPHTRRAYAAAWDSFFTFCPLGPWEVTTDHARAWRDHLAAAVAPATVNHRIAALSSFYSWAIETRALIDGREVSFFTDAAGITRSNPFRIARPKVNRWEKGNPLPPALVSRMMASINRESLTGARNYALLLTYLGTGYRNTEVRSMTWGDIHPHPQAEGEFLYHWTGKGGKSAVDPFPAPALAAIVDYLDRANRLKAIQPSEHIWQPLRSAGAANLRNIDPATLDPTRPISQGQVVRILRNCLTAAGLTPAQAQRYVVHDLRHTFCIEHYREFNDLVGLRALSHHANLSTLETYVRQKSDRPTDTHSARLLARLGIA